MFKKDKYKVLRGAISKELASFVYSYFLKKRQVARFLFDQKYISPFTEYWGIWNDQQVPNSYSHYSDTANGNIVRSFKSKDGKRNRL
jgi:hypothetical protein